MKRVAEEEVVPGKGEGGGNEGEWSEAVKGADSERELGDKRRAVAMCSRRRGEERDGTAASHVEPV